MRMAAALVLALSLALPAGAQEIGVDVSLEPSSGVTDADVLRLTVQVRGTTNLPRVNLPPMENLVLLGGPTQSSQVSFSSSTGRTAVISLIWTLRAKAPGRAVIPAFPITVDGKAFQSRPITIDVAQAPAAPPPGAPAPQTGGEARSFLEARAGTEQVWVGQPVPFELTLYMGEQVRAFEWLEQPSFGTFWVEDEEFDQAAERRRVRRGSAEFVAHPLERKILIPNSSGTFTIDPYVAQLEVEDASQRRFSLFNRTKTVLRRTSPVTIRVRPLPTQGRPEDFSGAVGSFKLRAALDRAETAVDDAVALTVTIEGDGFLRSVAAPELDAPPDLKVFPPEASDRLRVSRGSLDSRKRWEWVLVPLAAGELELPPIRFSYFDVNEGAYKSLTATPETLVVTRSDALPDRPSARGEIRGVREDLAFIKARRGPLAEGSARVHHRAWFRALAVLPLLLLPLAIAFGRRRARLLADEGLSRSRRAAKLARRRLQRAERDLASGEAGLFHEAVSRALVGFVADRFHRPSAGLTYDGLDGLLASREVDRDLRAAYRALLERCDFARYVPGDSAVEGRTALLDEAREMLQRLDRAVPR